jgi:23S rRNA (guanosine2251-2'-O)-methyltransferase
MSATPFAFLQCTNPDCNLRVPATGDQRLDRCVRCHAPVRIAETGVNGIVPNLAAAPQRVPIELALDNIRSAFNVGSIFRSADGAGLQRLHLCGFTPTPEHPRVAKTALGAEHTVPWQSIPNALALVEEAQAKGIPVWALESTPNAQSLWQAVLPAELSADQPLLLVAGSEVAGVDPAILRVADAVVAIPMRGAKLSLNVAIAVGVALTLLGERIGQHHANA